MTSWAVPVEAVRIGANIAGAVALAKLAADRVTFLPTATVEICSRGFVASVVYVTPGVPKRHMVVTVLLDWGPNENKLQAPPARQVAA